VPVITAGATCDGAGVSSLRLRLLPSRLPTTAASGTPQAINRPIHHAQPLSTLAAAAAAAVCFSQGHCVVEGRCCPGCGCPSRRRQRRVGPAVTGDRGHHPPAVAGRGRCVSTFLDKNRRCIGKSQSTRVAAKKKDAAAAAAPEQELLRAGDSAIDRGARELRQVDHARAEGALAGAVGVGDADRAGRAGEYVVQRGHRQLVHPYVS
jgi:hypothetical protein